MQKINSEDACHTLVEAFSHAPIKKSFGMTLRYDEDRRAIFDLPYNPNFNHALGGIHGGVFATLIDNAGWFTAAAYHNAWVVTVEFQTRLLEGATAEDLWSRGKIVRAGKKLTTCEMEVRTKSDKLIAVGSGTFFLTSTSLAGL